MYERGLRSLVRQGVCCRVWRARSGAFRDCGTEVSEANGKGAHTATGRGDDVKNDQAHKRNRTQNFQEVLFAMNIGFAVAYALFAYDGSSRIAVNAPRGIRDLLQAFGQTLGRIAPLGVHMRTKAQLLRSAVIGEVVFIVLLSAIALLIYLVVRSFRQSNGNRFVFAAISGLAALSAVPGCWLYIVLATWFDYEPLTFWRSYGYISVLEIVVAGGLLYLVRDQAIWRGTLVLALHYVFWAAAIAGRDHGNFIAPIIVSLPLSFVFPLSGFAWLRYARTLQAQRNS